MRYLVLLLAVAVAACGGESTGPDEKPVVGPTSVVVRAATAVYSSPEGRDRITLSLENRGGDGAFYLEFWALPTAANTARRMRQGEPVQVLAGYQETVTYDVTGLYQIQSVKVKSRPVNSAVYAQSDCRVLRNDQSYCP